MVWALIITLLACQEPFGTDRHDLEGFRVAAVTVQATDEAVIPDAWVVTDGRAWSDQSIELDWYLTDDPDTLTEATSPDAIGPRPRLPADTTGIGLVATSPAGEQRIAWLAVTDDTVRISRVRLAIIDDAEIETITGPQLALEQRTTWTSEPADHIPVGGFARLVADVDDPADPPMVRWMAVGEQGTFFELDRTTTDWSAGRILLDDDEIEERQVSEPSVSTLLALAVDDSGATAATTRDLWIGPPAPGIVTAGGRWLGTDNDTASRYVRGELVSDDTAPTGLRLANVTEAAPELGDTDPWGTESLDCVDASGPFDPSWLFDGRCSRAAVEGATVLVETQ